MHHHLWKFHFGVYAQALRHPSVDFYQQQSPQTLEIYIREKKNSSQIIKKQQKKSIPRDAIFSQLLESIDNDGPNSWRILSLFVI